MRLFIHQLRTEQLVFWRSREAAIFVFLFPLLLFALLTAVYNGRIYYAGGLHDGVAVPWFDEYDPATNTWTKLPDMPRGKAFHPTRCGDVSEAVRLCS